MGDNLDFEFVINLYTRIRWWRELGMWIWKAGGSGCKECNNSWRVMVKIYVDKSVYFHVLISLKPRLILPHLKDATPDLSPHKIIILPKYDTQPWTLHLHSYQNSEKKTCINVTIYFSDLKVTTSPRFMEQNISPKWFIYANDNNLKSIPQMSQSVPSTRPHCNNLASILQLLNYNWFIWHWKFSAKNVALI